MNLNAQTTYGVTFHYLIVTNSKDVDNEKLTKEFLGLSVTLSLLQEQVTESGSILGKTGMRQKGPRAARPIEIPLWTMIPKTQTQNIVSWPTQILNFTQKTA